MMEQQGSTLRQCDLTKPWQGRRDLPLVSVVGEKARGLYWLANNGFPTPPTWVLTTELFSLALRWAGVQDAVEELRVALQKAGRSKGELQFRESERRRMVEALSRLPPFGRAAVALIALPGVAEYWAVRASPTRHLLPSWTERSSFRSLFSVPADALWSSVRQVWASTLSRKALSLCAAEGLSCPLMAVVLQPMSPITFRDRSGILFSPSPDPSLPGILVQSNFGLGQGGMQNQKGDIYSIEGNRVRLRSFPSDRILVSGPRGSLKHTLPPRGVTLTEREALSLARMAEEVMFRRGRPIALEFVWRVGKEPLFVQLRSQPPA
jgi:hypothetical protein